MSPEQKAEVTKELSSGGLTKPEIAQRCKVPLEEVKLLAAKLRKKQIGFTWK